MALRLVEIVLVPEAKDLAIGFLKELGVKEAWAAQMNQDQALVRILVDAGQTEEIFKLLETKFGSTEGFRCVALPVEASLPRAVEPEKAEDPTGGNQAAKQEAPKIKKFGRISSEELYHDCEEAAVLSFHFLFMVILSSIVAAVGLLNDNLAVIIGAMVIAPFLGSSSALSLATTLGDAKLARGAVLVVAVGTATALILSFLAGLLLEVDPASPQLLLRTKVGLSDVVLALSAGAAGAMAFTRGGLQALVGVMVAVALLPPLVSSGLLLGGGHVKLAGMAFLLFLANLVCINLAGVISFRLQGISPATWWEKKRAQRATLQALTVWLLLLALLAAILAGIR